MEDMFPLSYIPFQPKVQQKFFNWQLKSSSAELRVGIEETSRWILLAN